MLNVDKVLAGIPPGLQVYMKYFALKTNAHLLTMGFRDSYNTYN